MIWGWHTMWLWSHHIPRAVSCSYSTGRVSQAEASMMTYMSPLLGCHTSYIVQLLCILYIQAADSFP